MKTLSLIQTLVAAVLYAVVSPVLGDSDTDKVVWAEVTGAWRQLVS